MELNESHISVGIIFLIYNEEYIYIYVCVCVCVYLSTSFASGINGAIQYRPMFT